MAIVHHARKGEWIGQLSIAQSTSAMSNTSNKATNLTPLSPLSLSSALPLLCCYVLLPRKILSISSTHSSRSVPFFFFFFSLSLSFYTSLALFQTLALVSLYFIDLRRVSWICNLTYIVTFSLGFTGQMLLWPLSYTQSHGIWVVEQSRL